MIAGQVRCRCWEGQSCHTLLPLDEADTLELDERIAAGDRSAVVDAIRDAAYELCEVAREMDSLLTDGGVLLRLAEIRDRQTRTGRQWHGPEISGPLKETEATDRDGKEPRGPRHRQDRARRARGGKPAAKRRRSC